MVGNLLQADAPMVVADEGTAANNTGTYFVPSGRTITDFSASLGVLTDNADGTWSWSLDTSDGPDESAPVLVTLTLDGGDASSVAFDLDVRNVAPTVLADVAEVEIAGGVAANTGSWDDPGVDDVLLTASIGEVTAQPNGTWSWSYAPAGGEAPNQMVRITAADSDAAESHVDFQLWGNIVSANVGTLTVLEGDTAINSGTFPPAPDGETVLLSTSVGEVNDDGDGNWSWTWGTSDGPDDSATVTITASYSGGGVIDGTFDLVVDNADPDLSVDMPTVVVTEGQTAANTGTFGDRGADLVTLSASLGDVVDLLDGTWSWSYAAVNGDPPSTQVDIIAEDEDGAMTTVSFQLEVQNLPPSLAVDQPRVIVSRGAVATNTGTLLDVGGDALTVSTNLGEVVDNGDGTWTWSVDPQFATSQLVEIKVTDTDMTMREVTFRLIVKPGGLEQPHQPLPSGIGTEPMRPPTLGRSAGGHAGREPLDRRRWEREQLIDRIFAADE